MALFNLGKRKENVEKPVCACNASAEDVKEESCCCGGASSEEGAKTVIALMQVQESKVSRCLELGASPAMRCMRIQRKQ